MPKNLTNWSNSDVKPITGWSSAVKNQAQWTPSSSKSLTQYTPVSKNVDAWAPTLHPNQSYFFDDPNIPFDSVLFNFDNMVNNNTDNQRNQTIWSGA